jgi:hypothetical protein
VNAQCIIGFAALGAWHMLAVRTRNTIGAQSRALNFAAERIPSDSKPVQNLAVATRLLAMPKPRDCGAEAGSAFL